MSVVEDGLPGPGTPVTPTNIGSALLQCAILLGDEHPEFAKWLQQATLASCRDYAVLYRLIERIDAADLIGISQELICLRPEIRADMALVRDGELQSARKRFHLN